MISNILDNWLPIHIGLSSLGVVLLAFASGLSFIYLIQERRVKAGATIEFTQLPPLEVIDRRHLRILIIGFVLYSLGLTIGFVGDPQLHPTNLQPIHFWTLSGWGVYVVLFFLRTKTGLRGRKAALYSLMGFGLVLFFLFMGLSFLLPGVHGWAS